MNWWWLRSPGNNTNNAANVNNDGSVNNNGNNVNNENEVVRPVVVWRILSQCLKQFSGLRRPVRGRKGIGLLVIRVDSMVLNRIGIPPQNEHPNQANRATIPLPLSTQYKRYAHVKFKS